MNREERTKAHLTIRELFHGVFETSARDVAGEEGQRIAISWSRSGGRTARVDKRKGEVHSLVVNHGGITDLSQRTRISLKLRNTCISHCIRPIAIRKTASHTCHVPLVVTPTTYQCVVRRTSAQSLSRKSVSSVEARTSWRSGRVPTTSVMAVTPRNKRSKSEENEEQG